MSDDNSTMKKVDAVAERLVFIELFFTGSNSFTVQVKSKDFLAFIRDCPAIAKRIETILYYRFFERVAAKITIDGLTVDMASSSIEISGRHFLQGRGKFVNKAELVDGRSQLNSRLVEQMTELGISTLFMDGNGLNIPLDRGMGDRMLDDSEMAEINKTVKEAVEKVTEIAHKTTVVRSLAELEKNTQDGEENNPNFGRRVIN